MQTDHNASLRAIAEQRGIFIGAAANARTLRTDSAYRETLAQEFNMLTPENELKFGPLSPHQSAYDFGPAEELVTFAKANDMRVRGHTLLWHNQNPGWLVEGKYNRHQALDLLHKHIFTTMGHFHGEIDAWDVVNEAVERDGSLRGTFWLNTIGPDYIEYAFRWAHEADPGARLFLNDYSAEGLNEKSDGIYNLCKGLLASGAPLHGVGMQMHIAVNGGEPIAAPPAISELFDNMKRLGDLGLNIHITEMDVGIHAISGSMEERLQKQAEAYAEILRTALRCPQFKALVLWGVSDRNSWIPGFIGRPDAPLIFNQYYQPKPAYDSLYHTLERVGESL